MNNTRFVSIEPIHEDINADFAGIDWIIIGAETGNRKGKILPKRHWIERLIAQARSIGIPVFLKDNLAWEKIREFPINKNT